jgi:hypothetical protein
MPDETTTIEAPVQIAVKPSLTDLKEVIKVPTEYKAPTGLNIKPLELNDSDFVSAPYIPDEKKPEAPGAKLSTSSTTTINTTAPGSTAPILKPEKTFDPDFTTDICVDTFDTAQHTTFLALNNRKQKKKRFKTDEEYFEAVKLSYLTVTELSKLENPDDKKLLVEKLKTFTAVMTKINEKLAFSDDEKKRLRKPIYELVKQNNFDIPPGLGLVLVSLDIISNRVVDLIMD